MTDSEVDAELSVRKGLQMHPWQSNMSTMLQLLRRKRYAKKATLAVRNLLKANVKAAIEHASKNDPRSDFDSKSKASNVPRSDSDSDDPSDVSK